MREVFIFSQSAAYHSSTRLFILHHPFYLAFLQKNISKSKVEIKNEGECFTEPPALAAMAEKQFIQHRDFLRLRNN
jgi:hypothetical protein